MQYKSPSTSFVGQTILYKAVCDSTNTYARRCLNYSILPEGTVIVTDHQYQGRGQLHNTWISEPYKNLTFSVIFYPTFLPSSKSFSLNIITTLALYQVLSTYISEGLAIKWPNDLYFRDRKLSGVLIENTVLKSRIKVAIIGIGINVNQIHFDQASRPVSLAHICQHEFDLQVLFSQLLVALEFFYVKLKNQGLYDLEAAYLEKMYWLYEIHTFRDANRTFQGEIQGLNKTGKLIIRDLEGRINFYDTREITFMH